MKTLAIVMLLALPAFSQNNNIANPWYTIQSSDHAYLNNICLVSPTNTDLVEQNNLLKTQNTMLLKLIPPPPKHHRKAVAVLVRMLPIIDHLSGIAQVASMLGTPAWSH